MQIDVQSDHKSFKLQMAFLIYLLEIIVKWKQTIIITAIDIIIMDWTIYIVYIIYAMVMVLHFYIAHFLFKCTLQRCNMLVIVQHVYTDMIIINNMNNYFWL